MGMVLAPGVGMLRHSLATAALLLGCADDNPAEHLVAKQTHLIQYQSCAQLETDLETMLIREISADIDSYDRRGFEDAAGEGAPTSDNGGREEGVDFSGTNNQESGVDEADLVKTDGYHIYALNGKQLHIFGVPEFGMLQPVSATNVEGHARQMLVDKDSNRAVVFSYINVGSLPEGHPLREAVGYKEDDQDWYWRSSFVSKITVFDMADRANLKLVREVYFEGYYQTARKVGSAVNISSYASIDRRELWDWYQLVEDVGKTQTKLLVAKRIKDLTLQDLTPQMYVRTPDGAFRTEGLTNADCRGYFRPYDSHARGFSSLLSFDLLGNEIKWDADHVVSNYSTFYQSKDRIVLAEAAHSWWWYWSYPDDLDQLNVHVFDSSRPGKASYIGSGRVEGMLSDQFAIDEHDGAIRLATTTGMFWRWWDDSDDRPEPENHIWVLEPDGDKYTPVGHVGGIAKGERIMSARFMEDRAVIVTFRNIDPLFTIDLSDNTRPRLVGELKIPGFSTYIHPLGTDKLLTIGVGGDDNGANWRTNVSLFDISDFANPQLGQALQISADSGWSWSEAQWEHKAFQYWAPKKLLAIPQSTYGHTSGGYYRYISKLELIEVDADGNGLRRYGAIDHSPYYMADPDHYWSYVDIRRSIFMGEYIYAISDKAISVHRTTDLAKVTDALLPGYSQNDYWWWW
jgi:uncharacterized secreted protein with C-terminal beta-propeller domain